MQTDKLLFLSERSVAYQEFFRGFTPGFFFRGGSTNSVEDRGQTERGSGGGSP
jgi:hypothetical protein